MKLVPAAALQWGVLCGTWHVRVDPFLDGRVRNDSDPTDLPVRIGVSPGLAQSTSHEISQFL